MLARINKAMAKKDSGFTLIELLVVIIIIGILAAIAIPTFLNQREKGWVSQSQSSLKNATTAAESYAVEKNGSYAGMTMLLLDAEGYNVTAGVEVTVVPATDGNSYVLTADHISLPAAKTYSYSSTTGVISVATPAPAPAN